MEVKYRQSFLRDLKKLKKQTIYNEIFELVFTTLTNIQTTKEISNLKIIQGYSNRYRIRINDYRIGIEICDNVVEVVRVLHRREFYRYFP